MGRWLLLLLVLLGAGTVWAEEEADSAGVAIGEADVVPRAAFLRALSEDYE